MRSPTRRTRARGVQAVVSGLVAGVTYHYRLVAGNATGTTVGADRTFVAAVPAPSAYRAAVLATPGLVAYWRLGEHEGTTASDETGAFAGAFSPAGVRLGEPGALSGDPDTSVGFDGGEVTAATRALAGSGTLEGWFDWRGGVAVMRDDTSVAGVGWILAFDSGGRLTYRLGGTNFITSRTVASLRDGWHHLVATKDGGAVAFYLDGALLHSGSGAGARCAADAVARDAQRVLGRPVRDGTRGRGRRLRPRAERGRGPATTYEAG